MKTDIPIIIFNIKNKFKIMCRLFKVANLQLFYFQIIVKL